MFSVYICIVGNCLLSSSVCYKLKRCVLLSTNVFYELERCLFLSTIVCNELERCLFLSKIVFYKLESCLLLSIIVCCTNKDVCINVVQSCVVPRYVFIVVYI